MSNEEDIMFFLSFCVEQYKSQHHMSGKKVIELFDEQGVTDFLCQHFDVLHTQGAKWLIEEIDEFLAEKK